MSIDAVLDADSKYTLCWTVWLRPRAKTHEKTPKTSKNAILELSGVRFAFFNARCKKSSGCVEIHKKVCSIISDCKKRKKSFFNTPKLKVFQKPPLHPRLKFEIFFLNNLFIQAPYVALECRKPHLDSCLCSKVIRCTLTVHPNLNPIVVLKILNFEETRFSYFFLSHDRFLDIQYLEKKTFFLTEILRTL